MAAPSVKEVLGPTLCQQCRKLVRWVRVDGTLRLVNAGTGSPHVCLRECG